MDLGLPLSGLPPRDLPQLLRQHEVYPSLNDLSQWVYYLYCVHPEELSAEWTCGHREGGEVITDRAAQTYTQRRVQSRELVGSCSLAQGAQLSALW